MNDNNPHFLVQLSPEHQLDDTALNARRALGLLTEEETAKILQLGSISTLATWRGQRKGPDYVKLGKTVFYTAPLLQKWIQDCYTEQQALKVAA
ncbi:hypothetical protein IVA80_15345 [Bradyrhizobium sp. 139]|uniref:hypothetical protein n=1 Tax=Bradyrhizobium sp. 139 TaxID=2782616 RepID=UPI001FFB6DFC|nr:hypothetical protein [Bradyrhizobium sp. 139]MCK1742199.1 hypothetical protein [Bradyrhizobium sp. 139]